MADTAPHWIAPRLWLGGGFSKPAFSMFRDCMYAASMICYELERQLRCGLPSWNFKWERLAHHAGRPKIYTHSSPIMVAEYSDGFA